MSTVPNTFGAWQRVYPRVQYLLWHCYPYPRVCICIVTHICTVGKRYLTGMGRGCVFETQVYLCSCLIALLMQAVIFTVCTVNWWWRWPSTSPLSSDDGNHLHHCPRCCRVWPAGVLNLQMYPKVEMVKAREMISKNCTVPTLYINPPGRNCLDSSLLSVTLIFELKLGQVGYYYTESGWSRVR